MITVDASELQHALGIVGKAVPKKATLPVLTHVKLEASEGTLDITGTDLEQFITKSIYSSHGDLCITVPCVLFTQLVGTMNGEIELEAVDNELVISGEGIDSTISGVPTEEFPMLPRYEGNTIPIKAQMLKQMIQETIHAVAVDESRPVLTGIYVCFTGDSLILASADGFRLSVSKSGMEAQEQSVIVSGKAMKSILDSILESTDATVYISETQFVVELEDTKVVAQTIQGSFPNYNQLVPKAHKRRATVQTKHLITAIKRAMIVSDTRVAQVKVVDEKLEISSLGDEASTKTVIDVLLEGEPIDVKLNGEYTIQALQTMGENVVLEDDGEYRPVTLYTEKETHLCLIMPMHSTK